MDKNGDSFGGKAGSARPGRTAPASAAAQERRAAALRENLQRRKAQARGQGEQPRPADESNGPESAPESGDASG